MKMCQQGAFLAVFAKVSGAALLPIALPSLYLHTISGSFQEKLTSFLPSFLASFLPPFSPSSLPSFLSFFLSFSLYFFVKLYKSKLFLLIRTLKNLPWRSQHSLAQPLPYSIRIAYYCIPSVGSLWGAHVEKWVLVLGLTLFCFSV